MVKKIKKKIKKGPRGNYAVPICMILTCLYGNRLDGKDFRQRFESPENVRKVLSRHLGQPVLMTDRVLSPDEFPAWEYISSPGRLVENFSHSDFIPVGSPAENQKKPFEVIGAGAARFPLTQS